MIDFVLKNWEQILLGLIAIVVGICTFIRTGSVSRSLKKMEDFEVKFRTPEQARQQSKPQEFSDYVDSYVLNPETNVLEKLETQKNIQAVIQSYADIAVEKALERFLPSQVDTESDPIANYEDSVRDLAVLGEAMETAEYYRDEFGLPDSYSIAQIYAEVDKKAQAYKSAISKANELINKTKEVKTSGKISETQSRSQGKQETVQSDGSQSAS